MKCVFLMFDSLNRLALEAYEASGGGFVPTPNFRRLAERTVTFDRHHVGSMPCMPARRDIQTGRLSFLHRSWGPLEPFDNSFCEVLRDQCGTYSHMITDHAHYWEEGGATYHTRYSSHEFIRGQEGDPWKPWVEPPVERFREKYHEKQFGAKHGSYTRNNMVNREFIAAEEDFPSVKTFKAGFEFLDRNRDADNWFLQLETFDPHEPFTAPERFKKMFESGWNGPIRDWPPYDRITEDESEANELRANYYALVALCDHLLGQLLDYFDEHDLWKDTALIVSTDHGYLLGEHDFWAKNRMNLYEELANIPLFIHSPAHADQAGTRRRALTQTIDLCPTFIDLFGATPPPECQGFSLLPILDKDHEVREAAIFGYFGAAVNCTDGRYTYHRFPPDLMTQEIYQYTLMPTHIWEPFSIEELRTAELGPSFAFTKGVPLLKIRVIPESMINSSYGPGVLLEDTTVLFDLETDPGQLKPIDNPDVEERMAGLMRDLMIANDCPPEALARLGLESRKAAQA